MSIHVDNYDFLYIHCIAAAAGGAGGGGGEPLALALALACTALALLVLVLLLAICSCVCVCVCSLPACGARALACWLGGGLSVRASYHRAGRPAPLRALGRQARWLIADCVCVRLGAVACICVRVCVRVCACVPAVGCACDRTRRTCTRRCARDVDADPGDRRPAEQAALLAQLQPVSTPRDQLRRG